MSNREQLIDKLFAQALEVSPAEREKLFTEHKLRGDDGVVEEVKALLTNYRRADAKEFLNQPLVSDSAQTLSEGQEFEGYRIVRLIAEGGMGEVYLAEDQKLKRKVALKLIKGHATKEILHRFQTERRILANLHHRNIAQLYEAGATADGLPFFAMEYVEGTPIDKFIREGGLSLNDRLQLFRAVCAAVSYAHQNLVIHRDLKPGNVIVNKDGEVKLLDFGIAKLLHQGDAEGEDATRTMLHAWTPQYASPEQVKGETITTVSDVYSLGVLLYEMLTGQRPYRLKSKTTEELTKAICEQDPTKPSAATGTQESGAESQGGDNAERGSSPTVRDGSFVNPKLLRGDLDNIVLKALRKEPERRYASVEQFSEDIRRHLEGLPVTAHRGSFTYRTGKFIKRNKIAVAGAALIVLTLAGGIIATTVEARRANRRFNEARQLAHTILFDYHDQIAALPGSTKVRERMVKDALQYLDNLSKDAGNDVSLLREIAFGYARVSSVQGGTGTVIGGRYISLANLGDTKGALESGHKGLAILERLVALDPRNRELRIELGEGYGGIAGLYGLSGPPEKTLEYCDKAIPILEAALSDAPDNQDLRFTLQNAYLLKAKAFGNPGTPNLGDVKRAQEFLAKAQPITERLVADFPGDTEYQRSLGVLYNLESLLAKNNGEEKQVLDFSLKAMAVDERLVELDPNNTTFRSELAVQTGNAGSSLLRTGDAKGALEKFKQALTIYESMMAADPNDAAVRRNAGVGYRNVATATGTEKPVEAIKNFNKALDIFAGLVAKDSTNADFRRQWAYTYLALSLFQVKANDSYAAVESAQQGIKIDEALVASSPTNATARNTLALLYRQLGDSHAALGAKGNKQQWSDAKDAYQKALDIYQEMRTKGTLTAADANKPDELAKEIVKCDAEIRK